MMRNAAMALAGSSFVLMVAGQAHAHIKLLKPASWIQESALGDPQKSGPCGAEAGQGVETNEVTTYTAGEEITVEWTETFNHEGHFRIALAKDRGELVDPKITGQCQSAEIMDPPQLPVLADGLFAVTTDDGKRMFSQKVKLPDGFTCDNCTLQLIQFMTPHGAPCLYYHCANVKIVAAGAAAGSGGSSSLVPPPAGSSSPQPSAGAGAGAPAAGGGAGSGKSGGTAGVSGAAAGGGAGAAGSVSPSTGGGAAGSVTPSTGAGMGSSAAGTGTSTEASSGGDDGGCHVGRSSRATGHIAMLTSLLALAWLRRRRHASQRVRDRAGS